jgi:subtilisin family serine protease
MNLNEYVVLRVPRKVETAEAQYHKDAGDVNANIRAIPRVRGGVGPVDMKASTLTLDVNITSVALNKHERSELKNDPESLTAGIMPMALHQPTRENDVDSVPAGGISWGLEAVGVPDSPFQGKGITVAVLDTGIDSSHPAFKGIDLIEKDFTKEGNGDGHGHGTHVAATIFGKSVNGYRMGVAPGIKRALIGKVLDATGGGTTKQITEAILWAITEGANIISMSLGIDFPSMREHLVREGYPDKVATSMALERYRENIMLFTRIGEMATTWASESQPVVILAASGNESKRDLNPNHEIAASPPAAAGEIKAIGAIGKCDEGYYTAPFSNTNVELTAPGMDIISAATGGGFRKMDGTSMATPHVAGVLALWGEKILIEQDAFDTENLWMNVKFNASTNNFKRPYDRLDIGKGLVQAPRD